MHLANRYIASLFLSAALLAPASILAAAAPQDATVQVRVYESRSQGLSQLGRQ
jgi:hypothetical protein